MAIDTALLADLHGRGDHQAFIGVLREQVAESRRVFADPVVKTWCGQRWRDLFLTEAARDPKAVRAATPLLVDRSSSVRKLLARRFLAEDVDDWQLELPAPPTLTAAEQTLLFLPGFVHKAIPLPGLAELEDVERDFGVPVLRATTHAFRGSDANVADILEAMDHGRGEDAAGRPVTEATTPGDVVLLGYSKGSADALTLLAQQPDVGPRVKALVCWAGAVGGSPTADDVFGLIKDVELGGVLGLELVQTLFKVLLPIASLDGLLERAEEWDLRAAVKSLTTSARSDFFAEHGATIDGLDVPIFHVIGRTSPLEVPYFQFQGAIDIARRVGPNDMQVAVEHAKVPLPMATTLAVCRAHHWDLALGPFPSSRRMGSAHLDHPFPRRAALTATVLLFAELGLLTAP